MGRRGIASVAIVCVLAGVVPSAIPAAAYDPRSNNLENDVVEMRPLHGMPRGVPPAARQREPRLPTPDRWAFPDRFPRTMGTSRMEGGALLWTDFIYDDNGAASGPGLGESAGAWPFGTYRYPEENQHGNGADIFRTAIATDKAGAQTWWRVDWNTLADPAVPAAAFAIDLDDSGGSAVTWGGNVGVSSSGVDHTLVITAAGAFLDGNRVADTTVDREAKSFIAAVPSSALNPTGTSTVWLAAGLANEAGDAFASLGPEHQHVPGQPNVFNMGFRTYEDEPADKNFWFEFTQATTLAQPNADVTKFSSKVDWNALRAGTVRRAPFVRGWSNRWYVSSVELGHGRVKDLQANVDNEPNYLGRVQPYGVYVPADYDGKVAAAPLTWLLHSLTINHNQYSATMPQLIDLACEHRNSICATTLGRGPDGFYRDVAELDFWEVWASLNRTYTLDPDRTIVAGYSMGGFGAFNLVLDHPDAFAGMVIMASAANEDVSRLENARWTPYYHAHGMLDQLVPYTEEALPTIEELDRLGYRYRFDTYPTKDHIAWSLEDGQEFAGAWIGDRDRRIKFAPGEFTYRWFPEEIKWRYGIGARGTWWVRHLRARDTDADFARVRAVSKANPERPVTPVRSEEQLVDPNGAPVQRQDLRWEAGARPAREPRASLNFTNVREARVLLEETGLLRFAKSTITVKTDGRTVITLRGVGDRILRVDGERSRRTFPLSKGTHRITITRP